MVSMVQFGGAKMPLENSVSQQPRFNLGLGLSMGIDLDLDLDEKTGREAIHSGHFMVSEIDDQDVQEDGSSLTVHETDCDQDVVLPPNQDELSLGMVNIAGSLPKPQGACSKDAFNTKNYQAISIDASLTKLLECMTLVYSGKLTSPRWKTFKGVKMRLKEKIRLNNIIWRAWHLQFVARQAPFVCQFASPLEGESRNKPEAVVLEGKYLKRGMKTVIAEYKKCRMFYRDRVRCLQNQEGNSFVQVAMDLDYRWPSWSNSSLASGLDDDLFMDFSDTLFGTLIPNEPFDFPNPREIARAGIADFIQPGLVQLQPALDDFMDTFEPLQDFLSARFLPTLPEEGLLSENQSRAPISSFLNDQSGNASLGNSVTSTSLLNTPTSNLTYNSVANAYLRSIIGAEQSSPMKLENNRQLLKPSNLHIGSFLTENFSNLNSESVLDKNQARSFVNPSRELQNSKDSRTPEMSDTQPLIPSPDSLLPSQTVVASQTATASVFALKSSKSKPPTFSSPVGRRNTVPNIPMRSIIQQKVLKQTTIGSSLLKPPKLLPASSNRNFAIMNSQNDNQQMDAASISLVTSSKQQNQVVQQNTRFQVLAPNTVEQEQCVFSYATPPTPPAPSKHKRTPTRDELVNYRRHSLTGQPILFESTQMKPPSPGNTIVIGLTQNGVMPAQKDGQFVVPKSKTRGRSRSISTPQNSVNQNVKNITPKPTQAISLTNISISPPSGPLAMSSSSGFSTTQSMPPLLPAPSPTRRSAAAPNTGMMPTSRLLAQFISPTVSFQRAEGTTLVSASSSAATPTVTIISSVSSSSPSVPQTLLLSPLTLTTVPGSDISQSLLVGTSGNMFSGTLEQKVNLPASPSSTLSPNSPPSAQSPPMDANLAQPKAFRPKSDEERIQYKEHKRVCHINAEQKRRCNIKHGFEAIHQLVPSLCHNPNAKVSKAAMLQKAVDYIRTLKAERNHQIEEAESLKKQVDQLNQTINNYQNQLPASGAPVPSQRTNHMRERFDEYVKSSSLRNWKFWIFSLLLEPLLESFCSTVSTASVEELCKTTITWLNQHCTLASLRPVVLNSLRHLSTSTNILSDPSRLPEEATRAVTKKEKSSKQ